MLGLLTDQVVGIKNVVVTTSDETGVSVDAGYEPVAVSWYRESGVGPELGGDTVVWHFGRALETHNG